MHSIKRLSALATFVALLSLPGISLAAQVNVSIGDSFFLLKSVSIQAGDTVVWKNTGTMNHSVTADDGSFDSGTLQPGQSYSHTFSSAGTAAYHCVFHGAVGGVGMSGTVVVAAAQSNPQSNTSTNTNSGQPSLSDLLALLTQLNGQVAQLLNQPTSSTTPQVVSPPVQNFNATFTVVASTSPNLAITGINAPAQLQIVQSAQWIVYANAATSSDPLLYGVLWGDASSVSATSSQTFTHAYARPGTYTPKFTVTDASSTDSTTASISVVVSDNETPPPTPSSCPSIIQTLSVGMTDGQTGGQVSALQNFLIAQNDLAAGNNTGTFGPATQQAVMQFQTANNISPVGFVGPQTRAAIAAACTPAPTPTPSFSASPTSGPSPLTVTFSGTVRGTTYTLDFGDGTTPMSAVENIDCVASAPNCAQNATIAVNQTHTYTQNGTYTAKLTQGNTTLGTATITVTDGTTGGSCVALTHNLFLDQSDATTGGDVTLLQNFLIQVGDMTGPATGYFGPKTLQAVQKWQSDNGVASSGTPDTTGYGYVGPKTRAAMQSGCGSGGSVSFTATPTSGAAPLAVVFKMSQDNGTDKYIVDFGDGTLANAILPNCEANGASAPCPISNNILIDNHTYLQQGTYTVKFLGPYRLSSCAAGVGCNPDMKTFASTLPVAKTLTITVTGGTTGGACVALTHNMGPDDTDATTGGDVTLLQNFLIAQGDLSSAATGFFGPLTVAAVEKWQAANGIASSGAPDTTGFGFVGPKTRAAMAQGCNNNQNFSAMPTSGAAPLAVNFSVGNLSQIWTYSLDFGDGNSLPIDMTTQQSPGAPNIKSIPHIYATVGTYTATLLQGGNGCNEHGLGSCSASVTVGTVTITVTGTTATGALSATPTSGIAPLAVAFSLPNVVGTLILDFGDGVQATTTAAQICTVPVGSSSSTDCVPKPVMHTYANPGMFTAILTQSTGGGITCSGISYDPNNPLTFQNLNNGASGCVSTPVQTVFLGKAIITVAATSTPTSTALSASLTGNGQSGTVNLNVGDKLTYAWSAQNAVSASATYTIDSPACGTGIGPNAWSDGNTLSGSDPAPILLQPCNAGHTYTITYTAVNAAGQSASATLKVVVGGTIALAPTASLTCNGASDLNLHANDPYTCTWSSTNAVSGSTTFTSDSPSCGLGVGPNPWNQWSGISGSASGTITSCMINHAFAFTFTATNAAGQIASSVFTLHVNLF